MSQITISTLPAMVRVPDAADLLSITERAIRAAIRRGDIPAVKIGRQLLIPRAFLEALLSVEGQVDTSEG